MDNYLTEEQQVEMLKRWWQKYGVSVLVGLLLGVVIMLGYQYWQKRQLAQHAAASVKYDQLLDAYVNHQPLDEIAMDLIEHYSKTPYANLAELLLAKQAVLDKQYDKAQQYLTHIISTKQDIPLIKQLAQLRLARVLLYQKQYQQALAQLKDLNHSPLLPMVAEVRGDIYVAMNKLDLARQAYKLAQQDFSQTVGTSELVKMKLSDLPEAQTSEKADSQVKNQNTQVALKQHNEVK
ncbi:MAG: tetratricopeptide repeat protein [Gammaproteobacteria bacterium]